MKESQNSAWSVSGRLTKLQTEMPVMLAQQTNSPA